MSVLEISRVDRENQTYDLAALFPKLSGFTVASVALLPPRTGPSAATVWTSLTVASNAATVLFAGPDADSTGAVVVTGNCDVWIKTTVGSQTDAGKVGTIRLQGGGSVTAPGPLPQVLSVQGRTGAVVLSASDVNADAAGAATTAQAAAIAAIPSMSTIAADPALRAAFGALPKVAATVTASGALVVNKHNPVDATSGARTMTLPTGQSEGTQVSVEKTDATTNAVAITGSVRGVGSSTINLVWQNEALLLRADSAGSWWPVAGHKTKTSLDAAYVPFLNATGGARRLRPEPTLMASPPTITVSSVNNGTTIGNSQQVPPSDARFAYGGGAINTSAQAVAGLYGFNNGINFSQAGWLEFEIDSPLFELSFRGPLNATILIDGQLATETTYRNGVVQGSTAWIKFDFAGVRKSRSFTVIGNFGFNGLWASKADTISKSRDAATGVRAALIDCSYGSLLGRRYPGGMVGTAVTRLGLRRNVIDAVSGTGWTSNGGTTGAKYGERLAWMLTQSFDVLIFGTSVNDSVNGASAASIQSAATTALAAARASFAGPIVIYGSVTPTDANAVATSYTGANSALLAALGTIAGPWLFINPITGGWTNHAGQTDAGQARWISGTGYAPIAPPQFGPMLPVGGGSLAAGTYYYALTASTAHGEGLPVEKSVVVGANGQVVLYASAPAGASSIKIYRGTAAGAENILVATLIPPGAAAVTFTDNGSVVTAGSPPTVDASGNPASNGTADALLSSDGLHINEIGVDVLGSRGAQALVAGLPAYFAA